MAKRRMTKLSLLADLRKLLARPDTKVVQRRQKWCGQSTWLETGVGADRAITNITIFMDPRRDGKIRLVIHELLHIHMAIHLGVDRRMVYELEEVAICAWENKLYQWLHDSKRHAALESWNQAIERKLR